MSSVVPELTLPNLAVVDPVLVSVAFVIEIEEVPSTNTSNRFTVVDVIVYATEMRYHVPVESVAPLVPIWLLVEEFQTCRIPVLVRRRLNTAALALLATKNPAVPPDKVLIYR